MIDAEKLEVYKAIGFVTKALLVVNALAAAMLAILPSYWLMMLLGLGVLTQASLVLIHRDVIMDEYVHELDGKEVGMLRAPSAFAYKLNIYVVWPLLLLAGVMLFAWGFISL